MLSCLNFGGRAFRRRSGGHRLQGRFACRGAPVGRGVSHPPDPGQLYSSASGQPAGSGPGIGRDLPPVSPNEDKRIEAIYYEPWPRIQHPINGCAQRIHHLTFDIPAAPNVIITYSILLGTGDLPANSILLGLTYAAE